MHLHFKVFGEGFPLVILHGLFGSLDNWQTLAKKFSEKYKVFIIDQRNHGKSPHSPEHSYKLMAEDLAAFFDEQGISKAHVIGHSMGGKTAMQFAILYLERVEKLIVVDISPKSYVGTHDDIFKALFSVDLDKISKREEADEILKASIPEFSVRQFLLKNLSRNEQGGFEWKMNLQGLYENYDKINIEIKSPQPLSNPALIIRGGKSDYITEQDIQLFKAIFPNTTIATVKESGHWVHAERPQEFFDAVMKFLG